MELFCPSCGDDLTHAPRPLGDLWCEHCGIASGSRACLLALPRAVRLARPLAEPPANLVVAQEGSTFRLGFLRYDETGTPLLWVVLVVGVLTLAGPILGGLLPFSGWLIYGGLASLFAFVLSGCAWSTWGRETLTVDARTFVIGRGLGRWRWERRRIDRRRIRSVELVRLPRSRGKDRNLPGFVLRFLLEDGVVIDFGFGLDYRALHHAARWLGEIAKVP